MSSSQWESVRRATDGEGNPVPRATRYIYSAGADRLCPIYSDSGLTYMQANPSVADANGDFRPAHLVEGSYRVVIRHPNGAVLADLDGLVVEPAGAAVPGAAGAAFASAAEVLTDTALAYAQGAGKTVVAAGDIVTTRTEGFRYRVVPEGAADAHLVTAGGVALHALPDAAGRLFSAQLGWEEGAEIGAAMTLFVERVAAPGLTLVLTGRYRLAGGGWSLPENFTIAGRDRHMCGFDLADAHPASAAANGVPEYDGRRFVASAGCTFRGFSISQPAPDAATIEGFGGSGKGTLFYCEDADGVTLEDITAGSMQGLLLAEVKNSRHFRARGLRVENAKIGLMVWEASDHFEVRDSFFTGGYENSANVHGDGIKTGGALAGPSFGVVSGCVFDHMTRDALDTTGGFYRGLWENNICLGCGLDLKNFFEPGYDADALSRRNNEIAIQGGAFSDGGSITLTLVDNTPGDSVTDMDHVPCGIHLTGVRFTDVDRALFVKAGRNVTWTGCTYVNSGEICVGSDTSLSPDGLVGAGSSVFLERRAGSSRRWSAMPRT